jgi:hypothetical protein
LLEIAMYALFEGNKQIGNLFRTEKEVGKLPSSRVL